MLAPLRIRLLSGSAVGSHAGAGNNITHCLHSGNASTNSCVFVFTCVQELCCLCKLICCCINHRWLTPDTRPTAAVPVQTMTGDTKTSSVSLQGERFCLVKSCEATMQWEIPNQSDMSVTLMAYTPLHWVVQGRLCVQVQWLDSSRAVTNT